MITDKDIIKIIKAQEKVFVTKEDLEKLKEDLRNDFNKLRTSVDAYAKKADTYYQEFVALAAKVDRHEKWIQQIAEKIGVELKT